MICGDDMKELDLTMARIANMNTKQGEKIRNQESRETAMMELNKVLSTIGVEKRKKSLEGFYANSIQDEKHSKRKEIHGKTYMGKVSFYVALAVAGIILASKGIENISEIAEYNRVLEQKIEKELTDSEQALYHQEHSNIISNTVEAYQNIKDSEDSLISEYYNIFGENVSDFSLEYLPFDERSFFNLSERSQDAIDIATDQVIQEYQERGK